MDKLTMAHDWCMKHGDPENFKLTIAEAWEYADAMQAEADKRKADVVVMPASVDDFQIDWSQAPDWAKWWAMDGFGDKKAHWYRDKPYLDDDSEVESEWNADLYSNKDAFVWSPSFNYQGAWQDSLRKRPQDGE